MAKAKGHIGGRLSLVVDRDRLAQLDEEGWTTREIAEDGNQRPHLPVDC